MGLDGANEEYEPVSRLTYTKGVPRKFQASISNRLALQRGSIRTDGQSIIGW